MDKPQSFMAKSEMFGGTSFDLVTRYGLRNRFYQFIFCSKTFSLAPTRNTVFCNQFKILAL